MDASFNLLSQWAIEMCPALSPTLNRPRQRLDTPQTPLQTYLPPGRSILAGGHLRILIGCLHMGSGKRDVR